MQRAHAIRAAEIEQFNRDLNDPSKNPALRPAVAAAAAAPEVENDGQEERPPLERRPARGFGRLPARLPEPRMAAQLAPNPPLERGT